METSLLVKFLIVFLKLKMVLDFKNAQTNHQCGVITPSEKITKIFTVQIVMNVTLVKNSKI
jgi:hypothetical protein